MGNERASRRERFRAALRRDPEGPAAALIAIAVAVVTVVWPLASVTYPPMTDLPMHAAHTAALRHFGDPAHHFADQFELRPMAVPYLSTYALGAALMPFFSPSTAVRIATACALLALPLGIAVLARGMRKSPLLGLAAAPLCWGNLVHWGFINFVGAIGLCAMAVGLALRLVDRPTRAGAIALAATLALVFFTHVFRFPFAIAGVGIAAIATAIAVTRRGDGARARLVAVARRAAPVVVATLPALGLFAWFLAVRPRTLTPDAGQLLAAPEIERIDGVVPHVVGGFVDPAELDAARLAVGVAVAVALASLAVRVARGRPLERERADDAVHAGPQADDTRVRRAGLLTAGAMVAMFVAGYLMLPMQIGNWWYVFPREATAAVAFAAVLLPDVPRLRGSRLAVVAALAVSALATARVPARHYARFERTTADFRAIVRHVPRAPRLLYLVFDHTGTSRRVTPFIHLPAWIQAERGGWLVFHFAIFGASPLVYRTDPGAVVPPLVDERWEWTPERFDLRQHDDFFDWFLVRSRDAPDVLFAGDPAIERVAHEGTWWLFRKVR